MSRFPWSSRPSCARWSALSLASLIGLTALPGCSNLTPDYIRPQWPVADQLSGNDAASAAESVQAALSLHNSPFATDPALKSLMALALEHNRDLRLAVLNIELAQAQWGVRQADLLPNVNLGLSGSRQTTASGGLSSSYSAGLSLPAIPAYEVDLFSRLRNLSDAARSQYLATEEARKTVHIGLLASIATTWLAWQSDAALLDLAEKTLSTRQATVQLMQLRFDQGASSLLDLRAAQSLYEAARIARAQLQRQQSVDENTLTLLLGQPLPTSVRKAQTEPTLRFAELPANLPSQVLLGRPDVAQAELQMLAANANIGAARAAFFPKITLTSTLGRSSADLTQLFETGKLGWSFGAQILQPIFDAGRNESNLKIAQASRAMAQAQYEKTVQTAFKEVADALAARDTFKAQWDAQAAQAQSEQDRTRLAKLRFTQGSSSYLDVLDAERSLFSAQQALIQVQTQYAQSTVTLFRALGGGWAP